MSIPIHVAAEMSFLRREYNILKAQKEFLLLMIEIARPYLGDYTKDFDALKQKVDALDSPMPVRLKQKKK